MQWDKTKRFCGTNFGSKRKGGMFEVWEIGMGIYLFVGTIGDLIKRELSVIYLTSGTVLAVLFQAINHRNMWYISVCGAAIGVAFLLLSKYTDEQIGYGDSWMILNLGIYFGIWELILWLGIVLGVSFLFSCAGLACRKLGRHTRIPFYPFLMLGYIGVVVW